MYFVRIKPQASGLAQSKCVTGFELAVLLPVVCLEKSMEIYGIRNSQGYIGMCIFMFLCLPERLSQ